ncbi:hypothetical protein CUMW_211410 [Citrus unshiu]|uniref:Uncharacterized protein n=1 Tax=Citrus unshiu TaxID=55188 RepID=A0A2H5QAE9_CITUN|nr:hypothetical protein CUMW_211410 [Citrus unshiu]
MEFVRVMDLDSKSDRHHCQKSRELLRPAIEFVRVMDLDSRHPATRWHYHRFHGSSHGLRFFQSNNDS